MGATFTSTVSRTTFKRCPVCRFIWDTASDFLKDAGLSYIGRQMGTKAGDLGLIMFNHSCGTTLSIKADQVKTAEQGYG
jgi:Holliday junction resolvase-like predicted endonuclease